MSSPASRSAAPGGQGQPPHQNVPHIGQLGWLARSLRYDRASGSVVEACVALDKGKATSSSAARRATRRFGCQRGWLRSNFVAARPDETENHAQ
jgi:hypothetical protein